MSMALVVIDVQSYFLDGSPKDLPRKIAQYINTSNYGCVIFTICFNPEGSNWEKTLHWKKCRSPEDLILSKEFHNLATSENTFQKSSYSALKAQNLEKYLQNHSIQRLDLCGIDTDACVLATAYDGFDKGYEVKILFDLTHSRADLKEAASQIAIRNIQSKNS